MYIEEFKTAEKSNLKERYSQGLKKYKIDAAFIPKHSKMLTDGTKMLSKMLMPMQNSLADVIIETWR